MYQSCINCSAILHNIHINRKFECRHRKESSSSNGILFDCKSPKLWFKFNMCSLMFIVIGVILFANLGGAYASSSYDASDIFAGDVTTFSKQSVIRPTIYNADLNNDRLSTTRQQTGEHLPRIKLEYMHNSRIVQVDLELNYKLFPKEHFLRYQDKDGGYVIKNFTKNDVDLCHYHGKIRGKSNSFVALSTCNGIQGIVADEDETYYIHPNDNNENFLQDDHYIFKHSDIISNTTCAHQDNVLTTSEAIMQTKLRQKRSTGTTIRGPYNANKQSSFVELVLVVDNKVYKGLGENLKKTHARCQDIANIINALYVPLNIFIVLVGVVVWNENNEVELSSDGDKTLKNFLHYRRKVLVKEHPNDNAQLLTKEQFEGGVVGKALKGPICTYEFSGGVSMDHSNVISVVATTVAHEMGHNFGMEHDSQDCKCPDDRCIMSASSSSVAPLHWSSCSIDQLNLALHNGMNYCLKNQPTTLFDSPQCGNGFVESGEQCDCGLPKFCVNSCCDPQTCMLRSNASCATGKCCDLQTCQPHQAGVMCRSTDSECDLPEYCTGESEYCPNDYFKRDTELCGDGKARCYKGLCRSRDDQCKLLWGPSGKSSEQCYEKNTEGTRHGNCGYDRFTNTYMNCTKENILCGMLQCRHLNERLEFGMESVSVLSHSFISYDGSIIPCRTAIVDLGLESIDPGLTPDGSICDTDKMCVGQKCVSLDEMKQNKLVLDCPDNCNGHGVCDNAGHCHCDKGFAPPVCDAPGTGGSEHSGPASNPADGHGFARVLYVFFLGVVPFISISLFLVYYWQQNRGLLIRRVPTEFKISLRRNPPDRPNRPAPGPPIKPTAPSADETNATLLTVPNGGGNPVGKNMFGQFKGFTLKPLPMTKPSIVGASNVAYVHPVSKNIDNEASIDHMPVRSAPPPPAPIHKSQSISEKPIVSTLLRTASNVSASFLKDHTNQQQHQHHQIQRTEFKERPKISSPILNTSTCSSAKELIQPSKALPKPEPVFHVEKIEQPSTSINRFLSKHAIDTNKASETIKKTLPIKNVNFGRSQSLRDSPTQSPFKRQQEAATVSRVYNKKRPNSIVGRPRNPPPRPPGPPAMIHSASASISSLPQSKEYDDCEIVASNDSIQDKGDNVYCQIEDFRSAPSSSSKPANIGSTGLLNEIVNEIGNRNLHSIYSQSSKKTTNETNNLYDEVPSIYQNEDIPTVPPELPKPNENRMEKSRKIGERAPTVPIKPAFISPPLKKPNSPIAHNRNANVSSFKTVEPSANLRTTGTNIDQSTTNKISTQMTNTKPKRPEPLTKKPPFQVNRTLSGRSTAPIANIAKKFENRIASNSTITK